ncbi:mechanosensitive ion channel [Maricurvus nonylphenolicus]|uniref:mechanosensitive ion channel family protein n=1 Tax=Maricurvus nonylphenolicus TaxID=1008307 RepID=UPI0036F376A6
MEWLDTLQALTIAYAPKFLLALLTLVIGWKLVGVALNLINKALERSNTEPTLQRFLHSLGNALLKALLIITVAGMVGIETTSFIAVLGAAGLAIGLALQGSLSNFAGGVLILLFKPFKAGDFIEAQGQAGVVEEIQIFTTMLKTGDNKTVIIPNGPLANGNIINYSTKSTRRVDFVFGIGYDDDIDKAKATLQSIIDADERILKDPASLIVVSELADSSVNFTVRAWVNSADYWGVYFDTTETVKKRFDSEGISIPYPQQDVHMHQAS